MAYIEIIKTVFYMTIFIYTEDLGKLMIFFYVPGEPLLRTFLFIDNAFGLDRCI